MKVIELIRLLAPLDPDKNVFLTNLEIHAEHPELDTVSSFLAEPVFIDREHTNCVVLKTQAVPGEP